MFLFPIEYLFTSACAWSIKVMTAQSLLTHLHFTNSTYSTNFVFKIWQSSLQGSLSRYISVPCCHDSPGWRSQWHSPASEASLCDLQLHAALKYLHRQDLPRDWLGTLLRGPRFQGWRSRPREQTGSNHQTLVATYEGMWYYDLMISWWAFGK